MKKILMYVLLPLTLAACTSTRYASTDDVYSSGQTTYIGGSQDTKTESYSEESDRSSSYQRYDEGGYGYGSYTQRLRRFHDPSISFDYYSPFSFGYPYGNSGYGSISFMWGSPYFYNQWGAGPYRPFSLYDYHIYTFHRPFWDQWYYPFGNPAYGYIPYDAYYPWYNNHYYYPPHYYYGDKNIQRYYGPRNWGGSNTYNNTGKYGRTVEPGYNYTPGSNSAPGNYTTPGGVKINKGSKTPSAPAQTPSQQPVPQQKPKKDVQYYRPSVPAYTPSAPSSPEPRSNPQPAPTQTKPGGVKVNKGSKN